MKKRIMLIDDDEQNLAELEELLIGEGYELFAFQNSEKALAELFYIGPDIILTDLKMKPVDGFQLADYVTHTEETRHIPIVGITGYYQSNADYDFAKMCGIKNVLVKPVASLDLLDTIETVINNKYM